MCWAVSYFAVVDLQHVQMPILLYFTCVVLVFVGVVCFFLAIFISALIPVAYFGCDFANFTLSSAANFNSNFVLI